MFAKKSQARCKRPPLELGKQTGFRCNILFYKYQPRGQVESPNQKIGNRLSEKNEKPEKQRSFIKRGYRSSGKRWLYELSLETLSARASGR
jgi:hypothetical protein